MALDSGQTLAELSLTIQRFSPRGEFVELNALLKLLALAPSGGAAKALIAAGEVRVDGRVETRVRRKLRGGELVTVGSARIAIDPPPAP